MTSLHRRPTTIVAGLLLSSLLVACGGSSSGGETTGPDNGATTGSDGTSAGATVTIENFSFSPATLNVKVGTKVTFIQKDSTPHNATATDAGGFKTPTMTQGKSYTVTFTKPGTYPYICTIHQYMKGTVVVS